VRKMTFLFAAACVFGLAPFAGKLGAVPSSIALVLLGVVLAAAASGGFYALAVAFGAAGAFASATLSPVSAAVSGALLVGLAFAERTTRVRGTAARLLHLGAALLGGALAGSLSSAFAASSPAVRAVAVVVAAVLVALPLLVDADDPVAYALDTAADAVGEPARASLREGAALRRNAEEVPLDRETAHRVRGTWKSLLKLAEARVRLERSHAARRTRIASTEISLPQPVSPADAVLKMVDQRLQDHVTALARAFTAADVARAAKVGIDDTALRGVEGAGEALEELSEALVETKG
jgi:MFS family permease